MVEVAIVGGGVAGAAAAWSLAGRGREVLLLERHAIGHRHGSSHGDARVWRHSYDAVGWVRMMAEALPLWRRLEEEREEALLTTLGSIDVAPPAANVAALDTAGVPYELVSGEEAMRRHPSVALPPGAEVLLQPGAGYIAAERAWHGFAESAAAKGGELREGARVERIEVTGDGARLAVGDETIEARAVVVTAGAWSRELLAPLGIDLPVHVTREVPVFFSLDGPMPPIVVEWRSPPIYALPSPDFGLKAAEHHAGPEVAPDDRGEPGDAAVDVVARWVAERFPEAHPTPHHAETCLYTSTDDERFVLERRGPVVVGSACSGHGFKFAPWVGERLADLVERG